MLPPVMHGVRSDREGGRLPPVVRLVEHRGDLLESLATDTDSERRHPECRHSKKNVRARPRVRAKASSRSDNPRSDSPAAVSALATRLMTYTCQRSRMPLVAIAIAASHAATARASPRAASATAASAHARATVSGWRGARAAASSSSARAQASPRSPIAAAAARWRPTRGIARRSRRGSRRTRRAPTRARPGRRAPAPPSRRRPGSLRGVPRSSNLRARASWLPQRRRGRLAGHPWCIDRRQCCCKLRTGRGALPGVAQSFRRRPQLRDQAVGGLRSAELAEHAREPQTRCQLVGARHQLPGPGDELVEHAKSGGGVPLRSEGRGDPRRALDHGASASGVSSCVCGATSAVSLVASTSRRNACAVGLDGSPSNAARIGSARAASAACLPAPVRRGPSSTSVAPTSSSPRTRSSSSNARSNCSRRAAATASRPSDGCNQLASVTFANAIATSSIDAACAPSPASSRPSMICEYALSLPPNVLRRDAASPVACGSRPRRASSFRASPGRAFEVEASDATIRWQRSRPARRVARASERRRRRGPRRLRTARRSRGGRASRA